MINYRGDESVTLAKHLTLTATCFLFATSMLNAGDTFTQQPSIAASQVRGDVDVEPNKPEPASARKSLDGGPKPTWIWGPDSNKQYVISKEFGGDSKSAWLKASSDNSMTLFINDQRVASSDSWEQPVEVDIQTHLRPGKNVVRAEVANAG